jgi:peptidoglycan/xylan/chitin deacetylase (PgdA/CDA1 family)
MDDRYAWVGRAARRTGVAALWRNRTPSQHVRVVMTHAVFEEDVANFRQVVESLASRRAVVTPARFVGYYTATRSSMLSEPQLLFTFDDGLLSSYEAAQTVLNPLGIKAIFFVPTAILDLRSPQEMREFAAGQLHYGGRAPQSLRPEEYLTMTADHLRTLHSQGHMILPHTHSHTQLRHITTRKLVEQELIHPKSIIEELLDAPAVGFASPSGTARTIHGYPYLQIARNYSLCFTALAGANTRDTSPLFLYRDSVHPWYALAHVDNILDGVFDPYFAVKAAGLRHKARANRAPIVEQISSARPRPAIGDDLEEVRASVARAFDEAQIDYVFLPSPEGELRIAVDRTSKRAADLLVRTSTNHRVVRYVADAAPWRRRYVLQLGGDPRRHCQLQLLCDPRGVGAEGAAVPIALARAVRDDAIPVPDPAAESLLSMVAGDRGAPHGPELTVVRRLLEGEFGAAGSSLAPVLQRGGDEKHELRAFRTALARRPVRRLARGAAHAAKVASRARNPGGLVVALVGPDGVGKSTLAAALEAHSSTMFRKTTRLHLSPGLLPPPNRSRYQAPVHDPHAAKPHGVIGSMARLAYIWLDTTLGWWLKVAILRTENSLVILERGWGDVSVDPARYRMSLPPRLIRLLGRPLPDSDLTLFLSLPVEMVRARKPELDASEIARQLDEWHRIALENQSRFVEVDNSGSIQETLDVALREIADRLAARHTDLRLCSLALAAVGGVSRTGKRYSLLSLRQQPRWVLPASVGAPGPSSAGLYRAAGAWRALGALALEALQRSGATALTSGLTIDSAGGLRSEIGRALGVERFELAAAITGDERRGDRALLSVRRDGKPVAFVKIAREDQAKLIHEQRMLAVLGSCRLDRLSVPKLIETFAWEGSTVLVLGPVETPSSADRSIGPPEIAGLAELGGLADPLERVLGRSPGLIPAHGDFAPWNSAPDDNHRLVLWDWEWTHLGLPLEDLFYWRLQRLLRFGHGSAKSLVEGALGPDEKVAALATRLGVRPEAAAPRALRACLERSIHLAHDLPRLSVVPKEALTLLADRGA